MSHSHYLGIKSKLIFLEAKGDAVVVLEGGFAAIVFGACADTAGVLCPACCRVWQKKLQKLREKPKR